MDRHWAKARTGAAAGLALVVMCGIAGYTLRQGRSRDNHRALIERMLGAIGHRGPDQSGVEINDNIAFGHNRLTVIEPEGGRQPRVDPVSGNALTYNGEIYDHRAFDAGIAAAGYEFRDHCDTETLFLLIQMYGVSKAAAMLDGMFAFAYHDAASDTLYLARDAFGQKPLFYAEADGELIFASEIRALLQHPSQARPQADVDALSLYMMMEYVPGTATGISGIRQLEPGSVLTFANGQSRIDRYWKVSDVARRTTVDQKACQAELDALLNEAVGRQLVADVPVGVFLSGGLDSSIIAALARRHTADVATFTVKFPLSSFDESSHAEYVAKQIGTHHTTIELDRRACTDGIRKLIARMDQPFADSSMLPTYLLCQATRQHVTVALGGDGADELFLGYPNFKVLRYARLMQAIPRVLGTPTAALAGAMPQSLSYMNVAFLLRQLSYGFGVPATMQSIYWMSAIAAREQDQLWLRDEARSKLVKEKIAEQVEARDELPLSETCQRHFLEYYLPDDILQKTDRASMYNSLEVRAPFLSSGVARFALSLPHSALFRKNTGKRILRSVAARYLSATTVSRPKHGFALPVSSLIRGDLRDEIEPVLLDRSNPMYEHLHHERVRRIWNQHDRGQRDYGKKVWTLFMLANFFRNTMQQVSPPPPG